MQLTIKKEVEETVDIELPYYAEYGGLNKVLSEDSYLEVFDNSNPHLSIKLCAQSGKTSVADIIKLGKPIEPSVFNNALQAALTKLNVICQKEISGNSWGGNDEGAESAEELEDEKNDIRHVNI